MRVDVVLRYIGVVMLFIAMFMLLSAGISYLSGMDSAFYPLLLSSLLTALLGAFPLIFVGKREQITNKEGFCIVVGAWLVACVVSMFPYLIWGGEFSLVNAWFESVSGLTTTGSTILNDVEALPRGLQFWRMSSTWIGGMGVVMFALVVLPSMGRSKMMLSNVELSTMAKDNYRYRSQIIVQILLVVYVGLTVLSTVLLKMAGMNWFDALCHAMSACATSGFSTKNASIAYFNSPAIDTILIFAMATAGVPFGLIYATVTGKRNNIFRSEVTRWYFGMLLAGGVSAQNPYISLQGANETAGGLTVAQPRTILAVDVTVEHDVTLSGPYARYAQKYLGVRAPLTDKTVWSVTGAQIALLDGDTYLNAAAPAPASTRVLSHTASENEFARLQPDKTDMTTPALEDAARTAAAQIFSLRRHRIELVTGEAGENVFGEGLKAALEEIDRLEQSYLELFLGKRIVSTETRRYVVCPQADKKQYIVCRFSPAAGLLPDTDLSGDIVLLQIEPSGAAKSDLEAGPKETQVVACRVADPSTCIVVSGGREYARAVLPVFEFGRTINVALPRRK